MIVQTNNINYCRNYSKINFKNNISEPNNISKQEMINALDEHTLGIYKDGKIRYRDERGVEPLLKELENPDFSESYFVDRRIGKASALLYVYGGAKNVKTKKISKSAIEVFEKHNIKYESDAVVESISNRKNTGICPMEQKVLFVNDPKEAYKILYSAVFPEKNVFSIFTTEKNPAFKGQLYDVTAFVQSHTLLNRALTNVGGCAIPNAIMSNTKEEATERLFMSALSVSFAFLMPLLLLPRYNKHFLKKNGIIENVLDNSKKIIQVSKKYLSKDSETMLAGIRKTGKQLNCEKEFDSILGKFKGKEEILRQKLIKTHEQVLRSDFMSTGILMGSIPWIATAITKKRTGRHQFSATFNMIQEEKKSDEEIKKNNRKKLAATLFFALFPGVLYSKMVTKGLNSPNAEKGLLHKINNNAQNFDYTSGVSMSKTINASKWMTTGFLAKLPSARDKHELKDRVLREGGTFVMFFGGDFLLNNILGRAADKYLGTKIMNADKFAGKNPNFLQKLTMPIRNFRKIDSLEGASQEVIKKTKNVGAVLYWVSLLTNMAILGFGLPRILNKVLKKSVEKEKMEQNNQVIQNKICYTSIEDFKNRIKNE